MFSEIAIIDRDGPVVRVDDRDDISHHFAPWNQRIRHEHETVQGGERKRLLY